MKKKILLGLFILLASLAAHARCLNNNWPIGDLCCIEVGDGSQASCTDGEIWMLIDIVTISTPSITNE